VKLYLPRASGAEAADYVAPTEAAPAQTGTETVLVAEHDPLVRNNLVAQLRSLGYTAHAACSAQEALAVLEDGQPVDLLLTDVVMPGALNGRGLAKIVSERWPGIGILYTSGYSEDAITHHGRLDPGVLLLAKPFRRTDLARMVRASLKTRKQSTDHLES
jgi:CheY-like chemotaxis protein